MLNTIYTLPSDKIIKCMCQYIVYYVPITLGSYEGLLHVRTETVSHNCVLRYTII